MAPPPHSASGSDSPQHLVLRPASGYTTRVIWTLTVTASEAHEAQAVGIGIVLQKSDSDKRKKPGPIFEVIAERHAPSPIVRPDARAIIRALEIAADRGYHRIRVRTGSNGLRRALRDHYRKPTGVEPENPVHRQILELARTFELADFAPIPRGKNTIAHTLAREGRLLLDSPAVSRTAEPWLVRPPRKPPEYERYFGVDTDESLMAFEMQYLGATTEPDDDDDSVPF